MTDTDASDGVADRTRLLAEVDRLTLENEWFRQENDIELDSDLRLARFEDGVFTLLVPQTLGSIFAASFAGLLDEHDAPNYVEMKLRSKEGGEWIVTVQKASGKSPADLREDAVALLRELYEWSLDACAQGAGQPFQSSPTWHSFLSTWEDADELLPRVAEAIAPPSESSPA